MKTITILGDARYDFAYYLGRIFRKGKKKTLLIDNSVSGDFFKYCSGEYGAEDDRVVTKGSAMFARGISYNKETFEKFDYCINFLGENELDNVSDNSDMIYLMPTYQHKSLDFCKERIKENAARSEKDNLYVIFRDYCNPKLTNEGMMAYLKLDKKYCLGAIEASVDDKAKEIFLEYNGETSLKGISDSMFEALIYVVASIMEIDEKQAKKEVRKGA